MSNDMFAKKMSPILERTKCKTVFPGNFKICLISIYIKLKC